MRVERIAHINILVKDLEKAMKLFSDIMGTKFIGPLDRRPRRPVRYAFDNIGLELVSPTSPDDPWGPVMEKQGEGFISIAFKVPDLDEAVAEFEAKGVRLERRGEIPNLKYAIFYPEDVCGLRIELCEYDDMTPAAIANAGKMSELPWFKG